MNDDLVRILKNGGIGILPTDTLYGIVASALNRAAVERVYAVRRRSPEKPCIILIADISDLRKFGIWIGWWGTRRRILKKLWPGAVSIVFPCELERLTYLHRQTNTLAFRLPADESLRELLRQTGPLIAPSANPEGLPPAKTIEEAKAYFSAEGGSASGGGVDFYIDGGCLDNPPSTLVEIKDGKVEVLREGAVKI